MADGKRDGIASPLKVFSRAPKLVAATVASVPFHVYVDFPISDTFCVKVENSWRCFKTVEKTEGN